MRDDRKKMIKNRFDTVATGYDHPSLSFFPETARVKYGRTDRSGREVIPFSIEIPEQKPAVSKDITHRYGRQPDVSEA
jgi:hypothetical protein